MRLIHPVRLACAVVFVVNGVIGLAHVDFMPLTVSTVFWGLLSCVNIGFWSVMAVKAFEDGV